MEWVSAQDNPGSYYCCRVYSFCGALLEGAIALEPRRGFWTDAGRRSIGVRGKKIRQRRLRWYERGADTAWINPAGINPAFATGGPAEACQKSAHAAFFPQKVQTTLAPGEAGVEETLAARAGVRP